jgi:hypothetical protein
MPGKAKPRQGWVGVTKQPYAEEKRQLNKVAPTPPDAGVTGQAIDVGF